ncbi:mpv17-like protein 2 isoform X2 [Liolophura sinensis]|uniref:mpv17-like protein 2 isoform X2 n=1 Tax=Liolophura sinensis TaxID=3198878 RepID=UPI00315927C5
MAVNVVWKQFRNVATLSYKIVTKSVRRGKHVMFTRYLLVTNTVISACSSGLGDSLQQQYELTCRRMEAQNFVRTRNIALTGVPIGAACHYWYIHLDRCLPGRTFKTVAKKILLDQLVCSPIVIAIFLVTLGALEHTSAQSVARSLWAKGSTLYTAEWLIWPPAQFINFLFLPTRFRVLYDSAISLGFDCYYPYVSYKQDKKELNSVKKKDICCKPDSIHEEGDLETSGLSTQNTASITSSIGLQDILSCCSFA